MRTVQHSREIDCKLQTVSLKWAGEEREVIMFIDLMFMYLILMRAVNLYVLEISIKGTNSSELKY